MVVTLVAGLLATGMILQALPFKYAIMPAALVLLILAAWFMHGRKKIDQASRHLVETREKRRNETGEVE